VSQNVVCHRPSCSLVLGLKQALGLPFSHAQAINDHITTTFTPMLQNVVLEGETQPAPKQLEWYPDLLAWQLNVPKRTIRKSPEYKVFQSFLVGETEIVSSPLTARDEISTEADIELRLIGIGKHFETGSRVNDPSSLVGC